ncbi:hypothetical protein ACMFMG_011423 [Clarireedia jacksonii]
MSTTESSVPEPPGAAGRGLFQCGTCSRSYSRVDHLARHVRSHTQEKPYRCEFCNKSFSRVDLLRRHTFVHNASLYNTSPGRRRTGSNSSTPLRASKACEACAEHHLKCCDEKPCRRCTNKSIACVVDSRVFAVENANLGSQNISPTPNREPEPDVQPQRVVASKSLSQDLSDDCNLFTSVFSAITPDDAVSCQYHHSDQVHGSRPHMQTEPGDIPSEAMDFMTTGLHLSNLPSGPLTPNGLFGFGFETDLDFSAVDLSFIDTYNTRVPFEPETPIRHAVNQEADEGENSQMRKGRDVEQNALPKFLQQSIWRFVPAPRDHGFAEQANLSLPGEEGIVDSPESFGEFNQRTTAEKLDTQSRDKILSIVLSQVKLHRTSAISAFPSVELLDNLIQFFLAGPFHRGSAWIHSASFRPKKTRPELLLAMAAYGAVLTPDRSLRKLGFAMQEVVRNHLPTVFEADNTTIRDLELEQAFLLQLEIGLWSGNSRKIEISEGFQQPLLTMLRRRGWLKQSWYPALKVLAEDDGRTLEKKWREWIERESFKRLVYHLLGHDAKSSISLLVSPLISYAELDVPLPEAQELWLASSAREWKAIYRRKFDNKSIRIPSLTECVADLDLVESSKDVIDRTLSCAALLHALWGMVWEYRKLSLLFCGKPRIWDSGIAIMSRYQELIKVLDYYRISYSNESILLLELILLHLHMSLEEIQLFVGLEGTEQARKVHHSVKAWIKSKTSRQAIWHAGQLFRTAKTLPPLHLRDFHAISLYHAGLAFWAYGLASRMFVPERSSQFGLESTYCPDTLNQTIWLDDEETGVTCRYISLGRGIPALHGIRPEMQAAPLDDPTAIMEVIIEIMRQGDSEPLRPNSPLVENLISIMVRLKDMKFGENVETISGL